MYFDGIGRVDSTPVYLLEEMKVGEYVEGPAMIIDETQTIVVIPRAEAVLTSRCLVINVDVDREEKGNREDQ